MPGPPLILRNIVLTFHTENLKFGHQASSKCTENFEFEVMRLKVGGSRPSHEWLQVLLSVSDHWRSVALSTVELFSRIDIIYPSMISFYLTVSQGIPLEIRGRINKTNTRWNVLSSEDIDRVVALRVYTKLHEKTAGDYRKQFTDNDLLARLTFIAGG